MIEQELYVARNEQGHEVTIDMRKGDIKKGQSPVELLLSSLGACGAVDIAIMVNKRRRTILSFITETTGERREENPRSFISIHCHYCITSPDLTEEELQKIAKLSLEKYCSVADSLKARISFTTEIKKA